MLEDQLPYSPLDGEDDDGYDVPFVTFTWAKWQEMQAQTMQRFTRFQRAIERKRPQEAAQIAIETHEMALVWIKEVSAWIGES